MHPTVPSEFSQIPAPLLCHHHHQEVRSKKQFHSILWLSLFFQSLLVFTIECQFWIQHKFILREMLDAPSKLLTNYLIDLKFSTDLFVFVYNSAWYIFQKAANTSFLLTKTFYVLLRSYPWFTGTDIFIKRPQIYSVFIFSYRGSDVKCRMTQFLNYICF